MFKPVVFFFFSLLPFCLSANPVIVYPNGSQYTLQDHEVIYIQQGAGKVFNKANYKNGNIYFTVKDSLSSIDPDAEPTDGMEPGSDEWCEVYVPFENGYTWDDQIWQRACQKSDG